jgi:hypothetical protein
MKRLFVNRKEMHPTRKPNPGDWWSSPRHYFDEFTDSEWIDILDLDSVNLSDYEQIIVGGGGLLGNTNFQPYIDILSEYAEQVYFWGVGINSTLKTPKLLKPKQILRAKNNNTVNYNLKKFKHSQITVRDYGNYPGIVYDYLPCISCMHPIFDTVIEEKRDFLLLGHNKITTLDNKNSSWFSGKKKITGVLADIEFVINEIKKSKIIITQSYHGAYWGLLCGKQVVILTPWNNKFFYYKPDVPMISIDTINYLLLPEKQQQKNLVFDFDKIQTYPGYLEECRQLNREFYLKVTAHG